MINIRNIGSKEREGVKLKESMCPELWLKLWLKSDWQFCNITKSGWFWKRLSRNKVQHSHFNRTQTFFKISVLRNFPIFTGKHLLQSLFNEVVFTLTYIIIVCKPKFKNSRWINKYWIDCLVSDLRNKRNSWFILFKSISIWFEKYKWNINHHCATEKHVYVN